MVARLEKYLKIGSSTTKQIIVTSVYQVVTNFICGKTSWVGVYITDIDI